ncbi:hypothetical protein I5Q34_31575 [Streptomyces sp. AV19]|uniref:hypothetical protein n=1 Tax=Streptomyces sp. AV19 TaxID=2793068 RepID=UPI0018FE84A2|nr:hypothetical protein [Streptomyces sp. AV19]MBH1938750.1 hypothetical protein [Streptomyces sp. AV19]MDG4534011.1 hypothetical protein [Streptomyces sp. AV19]
MKPGRITARAARLAAPLALATALLGVSTTLGAGSFAAEVPPASPSVVTTETPGKTPAAPYGTLPAEGRQAPAAKNCAKIPGKKKGSCNEPHRKCRKKGATAVSSGGVKLTCRVAPWDGRLRWLAAGE